MELANFQQYQIQSAPKENANSTEQKSHQCRSLTSDVAEIEKDYPMTVYGAPKRHSAFVPSEHSMCEKWTEEYNKRKTVICNGGIFIFCGPRGTGKTQQAVSIMRYSHVIKRSSARYSTAIDIVRAITKRFNMGKDELNAQGAPIDFIAPNLLVIDAVEVLKGSESETRELNILIDARYGYPDKATIIITNELPSALEEFLGESVVDRVKETGGVIVFSGNSFRSAQ